MAHASSSNHGCLTLTLWWYYASYIADGVTHDIVMWKGLPHNTIQLLWYCTHGVTVAIPCFQVIAYIHTNLALFPRSFSTLHAREKIMQGAWGWGYNIVHQHSCSLNMSSVFSNVQLFWLLYTKICIDPYPKHDFTKKNCVTIIVFFVMSPSPRSFWMFKSLNTGFCIWCVLCESMIYFHWYS